MTDKTRSEEPEFMNAHPGETILEDFLKPWGMTPYRLAKGMGVAPTRVDQILKGKRAITADTALRLSRFLGCAPEFWLRLQMGYDLREARRALGDELEKLTPYEHAGSVRDDGEQERIAA
jgi:addiction module HigA family antidote